MTPVPGQTVDTRFPNGQVLSSTSLTPQTLALIWQPLIIQCLGIPWPPANTGQPGQANPYSLVRIEWQQEGQPGFTPTDDVVVLEFTTNSHPYGAVRDYTTAPGSSVPSVLNTIGYTRVWDVAFRVFGPNCYQNSRIISDALTLGWTHDYLVPWNLYVIPDYKAPVYRPYTFQSQYWRRSELKMSFNEQITDTITTPAAISTTVEVIESPSGISETFQISLSA